MRKLLFAFLIFALTLNSFGLTVNLIIDFGEETLPGGSSQYGRFFAEQLEKYKDRLEAKQKELEKSWSETPLKYFSSDETQLQEEITSTYDHESNSFEVQRAVEKRQDLKTKITGANQKTKDTLKNLNQALKKQIEALKVKADEASNYPMPQHFTNLQNPAFTRVAGLTSKANELEPQITPDDQFLIDAAKKHLENAKKDLLNGNVQKANDDMQRASELLSNAQTEGIEKDYNHYQKDENQKLAYQLDRIIPFDPTTKTQKDLGLAVIEESEDQLNNGNDKLANKLTDTAKTILDLALGLTPIVGDAKDLIEAATGVNTITGASLSTNERIISGVLAVASIGTLGSIGLLGDGFKAVSKIINATGGKPAITAPIVGGVKDVLESAAQLGVTTGQQFKSLIEKPVGKAWAKIQSLGKVEAENGYKVFNKEIPINNPLPQDGVFARVVPKHLADKIKSGELPLSRPNSGNEAFVTALEDVKDIVNPKDYAAKLSLYSDEVATTLANTRETVALKFRFKADVTSGLRSPIELLEKRGFGFIPGGRTQGGAREWLIDNDAFQKGLIEFLD